MHFQIKLAERTVDITSIYKQVYQMCEGYYVEPMVTTPDIRIVITDEDIKAEKEHSPEDIYLLPYLETLAVYRKIAKKMLSFHTFLMHGSVVAVDDWAYMFTAHSGTGKTTHTKLWLEQIPNSYVVNGDKPLIRMESDGYFYACGTPWCGKEGLGRSVMIPLKAICILNRGEENLIHPISGCEAALTLMRQTFQPDTEDEMIKTMDMLDILGRTVPIYELHCNMDPEAAIVSWNGMKGL